MLSTCVELKTKIVMGWIKIMKLYYALGIILSLSIQSIFAQDISGKWKTVDDKSGFSRADVLISKNENGTYSGKILIIRPTPGKPTTGVCTECKGDLKNKSLVGLQIINNFIPNPKKEDEYINGKVFDPLSGNIYSCKAKLSSNGKRLTLRGYVGISALGRSQTWIRE